MCQGCLHIRSCVLGFIVNSTSQDLLSVPSYGCSLRFGTRRFDDNVLTFKIVNVKRDVCWCRYIFLELSQFFLQPFKNEKFQAIYLKIH